jgi:hypothetical protein
MRGHCISQRRACRLVGVDPKTVRRDRPSDNQDVRAAMRDIAGKRLRFGYPLADRRLRSTTPIGAGSASCWSEKDM